MISVSSEVAPGITELIAWLGAYSSLEDLRLLQPRIALGTGSIDWDAVTPDMITGTETQLEAEIARVEPYLYHPLDATEYDRGKLLHTATSAEILRFVGELKGSDSFAQRIPGAYVRELGLFIHATDEPGSGQLTVLIRHGKVWWNTFWNWRREIIVDMRST